MALMLAVISCSQKGANSIIGKWSPGTNEVVTFTQDGKMVSVENGQTETGEYYITNGSTLVLKIKDAPMVIEMSMEFPSANEMVLTMQLPKDLPKGVTPPPKDMLSKKFTRVSD